MTFRNLINTEARRGAAARDKAAVDPEFTKALAGSSIGVALARMTKWGKIPRALIGPDGLSTQPTAHAPRGPDGPTAIAWAKRRRQEEREAEQRREREGR